MEAGVQFQRLCHVQFQRKLLFMGMVVSVIVLFQLIVFPCKSCLPTISRATKGSVFVMVGSASLSNSSILTSIDLVHRVGNDSTAFKAGDEAEVEDMRKDNDSLEIDEGGQSQNGITSEGILDLDNSLRMRNGIQTNNRSSRGMGLEFRLDPIGYVNESGKSFALQESKMMKSFSILGDGHNRSGFESLSIVSPRISPNEITNLDKDSRTQHLQTVSASSSNISLVAGNSMANKRGIKPTSISQMTILLRKSSDVSKSMRSRWSSPRDRELQFARSQIENAPIIRNSPEHYASLFRNFSMFTRSYELMERILKVYIYKEGDKPIFHQPHLRGIYASEGWFMKLIEGSKQFVSKDPRKAHLFYLPFSSQKLRNALPQETFTHLKDLEKYLKNYTDVITKKYNFWKRASGEDHFLVACHDWGLRTTSKSMGSCVRALCNANVARGFRIGKDVSLPVTNIRTSQDPQKDLGGKPPSERLILAFFAGGLHGYLRPILLHYWDNKEPDMKIFGPMPRDIEGKAKYREYMKSSKYCICARGYEVHTPRVVEAIYHECVPVIISDNYVPPFFEVLDWEAFAVFILENDIPNLRNILLSIPQEKYIEMYQRVKTVQRHFLWHKKPVKYDVFHMILHSVWYNRVFQLRF